MSPVTSGIAPRRFAAAEQVGFLAGSGSASIGRRALINLGAAVLLALPASTSAAEPGEVRAVLESATWDETAPFTREDFRRLDESDDSRFYDDPKLVQHIDDAAVASTTSFYSQLFASLAASGEAPPRPLSVLDLCSSWVSHYPPAGTGPPLGRVEGLGMNAAELAANPVLTGYKVQDLNRSPALPYADASFDAVTCTVSIDYLVRPLEVVAEAARVLRPGGKVVLIFSSLPY